MFLGRLRHRKEKQEEQDRIDENALEAADKEHDKVLLANDEQEWKKQDKIDTLKRLRENATTEKQQDVVDAEIEEEKQRPLPPLEKRETKRFTQEEWNRFGISQQEILANRYHVILTDHETRNEKWKRRAKKVNLKNFDKGMKTFDNAQNTFWRDFSAGMNQAGMSNGSRSTSRTRRSITPTMRQRSSSRMNNTTAIYGTGRQGSRYHRIADGNNNDHRILGDGSNNTNTRRRRQQQPRQQQPNIDIITGNRSTTRNQRHIRNRNTTTRQTKPAQINALFGSATKSKSNTSSTITKRRRKKGSTTKGQSSPNALIFGTKKKKKKSRKNLFRI